MLYVVLDLTLLHGCFPRFFKLYKWYQIAQRITYFTKQKIQVFVVDTYKIKSLNTCTYIKIPKPKPGGNFVRYASEHRLSKVLGESPPEAAVHRSSTKSVFSQNSLEKTCTGVFF